MERANETHVPQIPSPHVPETPVLQVEKPSSTATKSRCHQINFLKHKLWINKGKMETEGERRERNYMGNIYIYCIGEKNVSSNTSDGHMLIQ